MWQDLNAPYVQQVKENEKLRARLNELGERPELAAFESLLDPSGQIASPYKLSYGDSLLPELQNRMDAIQLNTEGLEARKTMTCHRIFIQTRLSGFFTCQHPLMIAMRLSRLGTWMRFCTSKVQINSIDTFWLTH